MRDIDLNRSLLVDFIDLVKLYKERLSADLQ